MHQRSGRNLPVDDFAAAEPRIFQNATICCRRRFAEIKVRKNAQESIYSFAAIILKVRVRIDASFELDAGCDGNEQALWQVVKFEHDRLVAFAQMHDNVGIK